MGKSVRKYRKNRDYDYLEATPKSPKASTNVENEPKALTTSAYAIIDATKRVPGSQLFASHYQPYSNDLLSSPREFVPLADLAPGDCSSFHVLTVLTCACVGPYGAVVMPFAFLQGGFLLTNSLLVIFALATVSVSVWLVHLGVEYGTYSIHGLATVALGKSGTWLTGLLQLVVSAGRVVACFLLLFDDFRSLLARSFRFDFDAYGDPINSPPTSSTIGSGLGEILTNRILFGELIMLVVVVPFCLKSFYYRKLKVSSSLSVLALVLAAAFAIKSAHRLHEANAAASSQGFNRDYISVPLRTFPQVLGIFGSCFAYQHHALHAFYAMHDRSIAEFARISVFAMVLSLLICYSIGIGGYVAFLKSTTSDILTRYDFRSNASNLAYWIAVPASAIVGIALEVVVSSHSVQFLTRSRWSRAPSSSSTSDDVLFQKQHSPRRYDPGNYDGVDSKLSPTERASDAASLALPKGLAWKRYLLTTLSLAAIAQIALFVDTDIATVLTLTGAYGGLLLLFSLPGAISLKLANGQRSSSSGGYEREGSSADSSGWLLSRGLPILFIFLGLAASAACIASYEIST